MLTTDVSLIVPAISSIDNSEQKVATLQKDQIPIYEPVLENLIRYDVAAGHAFADHLRRAATISTATCSSKWASTISESVANP
jgi:UDP-glucose 6-dehydrogenase